MGSMREECQGILYMDRERQEEVTVGVCVILESHQMPWEVLNMMPLYGFRVASWIAFGAMVLALGLSGAVL